MGITNSSDPQFESATFIEEFIKKPVSIGSYVRYIYIVCHACRASMVHWWPAAPIWRSARYTHFYTVSSVLLILIAGGVFANVNAADASASW